MKNVVHFGPSRYNIINLLPAQNLLLFVLFFESLFLFSGKIELLEAIHNTTVYPGITIYYFLSNPVNISFCYIMYSVDTNDLI